MQGLKESVLFYLTLREPSPQHEKENRGGLVAENKQGNGRAEPWKRVGRGAVRVCERVCVRRLAQILGGVTKTNTSAAQKSSYSAQIRRPRMSCCVRVCELVCVRLLTTNRDESLSSTEFVSLGADSLLVSSASSEHPTGKLVMDSSQAEALPSRGGAHPGAV